MFGLVPKFDTPLRKNFLDPYDEALDRMFDRTFNAAFEQGVQANVRTSEDGYHIEVIAPGLNRDDIKVEMLNGHLTVYADVEEKKEGKNEVKEYYRRSFRRTWKLPDYAKDEDVTANYDAGILHINVPIAKPEDRKELPRTINVD